MARIDIRISDEDKERWILSAEKSGISLTEFVHTAVEKSLAGGEVAPIVHTEKEKVVPVKEKSVHTEKVDNDSVHTDTPISVHTESSTPLDEARLIGEINGALNRGEPENWKRVRKLVSDLGYDWDITTRVLKRGNNVIKRF